MAAKPEFPYLQSHFAVTLDKPRRKIDFFIDLSGKSMKLHSPGMFRSAKLILTQQTLCFAILCFTFDVISAVAPSVLIIILKMCPFSECKAKDFSFTIEFFIWLSAAPPQTL
jgi:hypothetical protein